MENKSQQEKTIKLTAFFCRRAFSCKLERNLLNAVIRDCKSANGLNLFFGTTRKDNFGSSVADSRLYKLKQCQGALSG